MYVSTLSICYIHVLHVGRGGDIGGTEGTVPQKYEVGGRPMHPSPQIFCEVVIVVFLVRKGSYTTFNIVKIRKILGKERENLKNLVDK